MKTILNLAWLAISLTDIALGYLFIWQWAAWETGGLFVMGLGALNAWFALRELRRPKVIKFNHMKGVTA